MAPDRWPPRPPAPCTSAPASPSASPQGRRRPPRLLRASLQRDRSRLRARPASTPSASPSSPPPLRRPPPPRRLRPPARAPRPSAAPRLPSPEQGAQEVEAAAVSVRVVPAAERAERVVLRLPPGALACEAGATLPDIPAEVLSETGAPLRLPDEVPGEAPGYVFREVPALREAIRPRRERRARRLRRPRRLRPHRPPGAPHALRVAAEGGATGLQLGTGAALPSLALELLDRFENPAPAPPAPPLRLACFVAAAAGPVAWPAGHASVVLSGLTIGDGVAPAAIHLDFTNGAPHPPPAQRAERRRREAARATPTSASAPNRELAEKRKEAGRRRR
eukprot:tig00020829_g14375.t1